MTTSFASQAQLDPNATFLPWLKPESVQDSVAISDACSSYTYGELTERAKAAAQLFKDRGITKGDVIALMLPNRTEFLISMFGAWMIGATITPINPVFTDNEALFQIDDSGSKLVVTLDPQRFAGHVEAVGVEEINNAAPAPDVDPITPDPDDLAFLIYTSGSTGRPKGVMQVHGNLNAMSAQMVDRMHIDAEYKCILVLPLFHVNAICVSVLTPLRVGGSTRLIERFAPAEFLEIVAKEKGTYFSCVPTILAALTMVPKEALPDLSSLKFIICGAAPLSVKLHAAAEAHLDVAVCEGYGLTEGTCGTTVNPIDGVRKTGTVGQALTGQSIRIVDPEGNELPAGEPGEVTVQGPTVMRGYLNNEEATAQTVVDGWLHTGDVGFLDEDGYLTLVDRIKDMIIRGGENLYPKEIENAIYHVEGVREVAVVGKPDERLGEIPVAFVAGDVSEDRVLEACRQSLTKIKIPVEIYLYEELPKNPLGKLDKPLMRKILAEG